MTKKTFRELYLSDEIPFEAIDEFSYEWGMSDDERTLGQYLGFNDQEEDAWISVSEEALKELLDRRKPHSLTD